MNIGDRVNSIRGKEGTIIGVPIEVTMYNECVILVEHDYEIPEGHKGGNTAYSVASTGRMAKGKAGHCYYYCKDELTPITSTETELVKGEWYRRGFSGSVLCFTGMSAGFTIKAYGFSSGIWTGSPFICGQDTRDFTKLSNSEVLAVLTEEAKRRGFKKGVQWKSAYDGKTLDRADGGVFEMTHNGLALDGMYVMYKGKWATLITKPDSDKPEEQEFDSGATVQAIVNSLTCGTVYSVDGEDLIFRMRGVDDHSSCPRIKCASEVYGRNYSYKGDIGITNEKLIKSIRPATADEIKWLEACEKAGDFVSKEYALSQLDIRTDTSGKGHTHYNRVDWNRRMKGMVDAVRYSHGSIVTGTSVTGDELDAGNKKEDLSFLHKKKKSSVDMSVRSVKKVNL